MKTDETGSPNRTSQSFLQEECFPAAVQRVAELGLGHSTAQGSDGLKKRGHVAISPDTAKVSSDTQYLTNRKGALSKLGEEADFLTSPSAVIPNTRSQPLSPGRETSDTSLRDWSQDKITRYYLC